jgi:hypothetical protein
MLAMSDRATDREPEKRAFRHALFGGPAQRVVYAGPDQSLHRLGEAQRMACLNRTGRNQATARANIVTLPRSTSAWVRGPHKAPRRD